MEILKIKPCNNTFFRGGNNFDIGVNGLVRSRNTPYPSVFFGAIYTALLTRNDDFRKIFLGQRRCDHEKILNIGQVYLYNEESNEVYIPAPKDLFINKRRKIAFGKYNIVDTTYISLPFKIILEKEASLKNYKRITNHYINIRSVYDGYLKKANNMIDLKDESDIFKKNIKVGIGINEKIGTIEHDNLYKIEQTEFITNDWSYLVEYEVNLNYLKEKYKGIDFNLLDKGYLKLGGENKVARFEKVSNSKVDDFNQYIEKNKRHIEGPILKLIFTSDVYFEENIMNVFEKMAEVIGIVNDKPIYIGGYDIVKGKNPRMMYKGYGAGTIVLLEVKNYRENKIRVKDYIDKELEKINPKGFGKYIIMKEEF